MLENVFIEKHLTEVLKTLENDIRIHETAYKEKMEEGLSILLEDLKEIKDSKNISYVNISYLYSNIINGQSPLLVNAYDEDWYVGEVLYSREIEFGDYFSLLASMEELFSLEVKKSLGKINESIIQKIILECIRIIGKLVEQVFRKAIRSPKFYKRLEDLGVDSKDRQFMIFFGEYLDHCEPLYINKKETASLKEILYDFDKHLPCRDKSFTGLSIKSHPIEDVDFSDTWFHKSTFEACTLKGLYLFNTTFNQCVFRAVVFDECTLLSSLFHGCVFIDCEFENINSRLFLADGIRDSFLHEKTSFIDCQYEGMAVELIDYLGA